MKYQTWILEKLIEKYESRKTLTGNVRKVAFRMQDESALSQELEHAEEKEQFLTALDLLKQKGLVDYSWVRFEKDNIVERVWLVLDEEKVRESYRILARIPKGDIICVLRESLINSINQMKPLDNEIQSFFKKQLEQMEQSSSIPRFFTDRIELNEDLIKCLVYLSQNNQEVQERVLSSLLYNDSKYFERTVKGKVLSVLKAINKGKGEELSDEELLRERGVVKWPEILEFTGRLAVLFKQGELMDFSVLTYGAYINSLMVEMVDKVCLYRIKKVIFIENKANYVWYITQEKKEEELVVYHGGCYSPVKGRWFKKICEACIQDGEQIKFYHWSDIDVGGFRIFSRLKTEIVSSLEPFQMDIETLEKNRDKGMPMNEHYRMQLTEMINDCRYEEFKFLIERMIELNIRLEQEQLLY
jgi:hypothetical protein